MQIRDEIPSVIEKELEEHKDRINQLDIRLADTSGRLLSIVEDLKAKTEEKAGSLFGLRKAGLEEFMAELNNMDGELQSLRAQVRDIINSNTEAYEVGVSSLLDNISRDMTYRVETIEKDAESSFGKMNTVYEAIVSNLTSKFQGAFQKEIENALKNFTNDLKTNNSKAKESIVLRLEENKEAIKEMIYDAVETLTEKLNDTKTTFEEIQQSAATNTEGLDKARNQIDIQLNSNMNEKKEVMTDLRDKISKILENIQEENHKSSNNWIQQFKESFSQYEETIVSTLIQHKMNTTTRTLEEITEQDSLLDIIKTNVLTLSDSLKETNENDLNSLQGTMKDILNEKGAEITKANLSLQEKVEKEINLRKTEIEQSIETLIDKNIEENINASTSNLTELKQSLSEIVLRVFEDSMQKISGFNSKLNSKLSETEAVLNKQSDALEESASTLAELDSNVTQKFEPQAKILLENLEKTIGKTTELKEITAELDKLSANVNEKVNEAESGISSIKKTIFDVLEEKEGVITQDIEDILAKFDKILDQANLSVKQKIDELKNGITTSGKDYLTKFDNRIEQIITRFNQLLSRPSTTIHEGTVDFKGSFSNLLSVQTTKYRHAVYASIDKINEFLENLGTEVETAAKQLNEKLSETTSSQIQNYKDTVVTHKDQLLQIVTKRVEGISNELSTVVNIIPSELEAAVVASNKAAQALGTIQKLSRKAEPLPIEQTYRVIGDANILFNIKAILERTKANCVLVMPKFEDIPVDALSNVKKTIRVTCVTELTEANMKDAGQLQERGNVRVRNYPDPKIYVISRDSEEVLIAPAVRGKDLVGILSTNDHLIELINSELLSGYTAKSKAI
jgi:DNA repair exonuclease SbcCD ATPase subunit